MEAVSEKTSLKAAGKAVWGGPGAVWVDMKKRSFARASPTRATVRMKHMLADRILLYKQLEIAGVVRTNTPNPQRFFIHGFIT